MAYRVSTSGSVAGQSYSAGDSIIYGGESWDKIDSTDQVTTVAGRVGDIVLSKSDVGLGSVDNTSDADKPISSATQTALNGKANASHTHAVADVTGLQSALDGKAPTYHGHTIADVSGLQSALDGKAASSHTHAIANVTGLQSALDGTVKTTGDQSISGYKTFNSSVKAYSLFIQAQAGERQVGWEFPDRVVYQLRSNAWPKWAGWAYIDAGDTPPAEMVRGFYRSNFWTPLRLEEVQSQDVARTLFDFAVNAGTGTAAKLAQIVVGTTPDGKMGPKTLTALNNYDPDLFLARYALAKLARYEQIITRDSSQRGFLLGWLRRTLKEAS